MRRIVAGIVVVALAFTLIVVAYARANYNPCSPWLFGRDSDAVISAESRELMQQARDAYQSDNPLSPEDALTTPVKVSICGNMATLSVGGEMLPNNLGYASFWKDVYNRHHPSGLSWLSWCGKMRLVWKTGQMDQQFCGPQL